MKGQALAGLGQVADVESRQNIAEEQLKMAKGPKSNNFTVLLWD